MKLWVQFGICSAIPVIVAAAAAPFLSGFAGATPMAILAVALLACVVVSRYAARSLAGQIGEFRKSIDSFQPGDEAFLADIAARRSELGGLARSLQSSMSSSALAHLDDPEIRAGLTAFRSSRVAMLQLDDAGVIQDLNTAAEKMFLQKAPAFQTAFPGFAPDKVIGLPVAKLGKQFDIWRRKLADADAKPLDADISFAEFAFALRLSVIQSANGGLAGHLVEWVDVTETRRATSILATLYRAQLMLEFDAAGDLIDANGNFADLAGRDRSKLIGSSYETLFSAGQDSPDQDRITWPDLKSGKATAGLCSIAGVSGGPAHLQAALIPSLDSDGKVTSVVMTAFDVTDLETTRREAAQERTRMIDAQRAAVSQLNDGLDGLANGNLQQQLSQPFAGDLEELRQTYNAALETLNWVIGAVLVASEGIASDSVVISDTTEELSKRTDTQTASLEKTSTALGKLTQSVTQATETSQTANTYVSQISRSAAESGGVVQDAVNAMSEIESSSTKISQIIGVIEDIAFQTNLLALNAGVEAARAGEFGRGFAVVATEVRALAQRSSDAANEIKSLISQSTAQVENGVSLVNRAGEALNTIAGQISAASDQVSGIAQSSMDQADELRDITQAVSQLDQAVGLNAASVAGSAEISQKLRQDAEKLTDLVARFRTSPDSASGAQPVAGVETANKPARPPMQKTVRTPQPARKPGSTGAKFSHKPPTKKAPARQGAAKPAVAAVAGNGRPRVENGPAAEILNGSWEDF